MRIDLWKRFRHAIQRFPEANLRFTRQTLMKLFGVPWNRTISALYSPVINQKVQIVSKVSEGLTLRTSDDSFFGASLEHHFVPRYLFRIRGALINLSYGDVYMRSEVDGKWNLVAETSEWPIESRVQYARLPSDSSRYPKLRGVYAKGLLSTGFYHRLTEEIPTLFSFSEKTRLVVRNRDREILQQYGLINFELVGEKGFIEVETLEVISKGTDVGYLHPFNRKVLTNSFCKNQKMVASRKIYLSRKELRRSILNEEEVIDLVKPKGFEVVDSGTMSIQEQIKLFSEAKFVIAPHGGAITNLLYSSDASLLEILPLERINRCFEWQSLVCGHRYSAIFYSQRAGVDLAKLNDMIGVLLSS
jgi:hypothetical protein